MWPYQRKQTIQYHSYSISDSVIISDVIAPCEGMANTTNMPDYTVPYEYYLDYLDLRPVDASKLKANRYSIVIAFWIGLVSFVAFLFFILFYMSRSGSASMKTGRAKKLLQWNYSETIHQNLVNNDTVRTSDDNQVEEIEELCSNNRTLCHHMNNAL